MCIRDRQTEVVSTLETLEKIWDEYQVYSGDELNHVSDMRLQKEKKIDE